MIINRDSIVLMGADQCARYLDADEALVEAIDQGYEIMGAAKPYEKVEEPVVLNREQAKTTAQALGALIGFETFMLGEPFSWHTKTAAHYLPTLEAFSDLASADTPHFDLAA